MYDERFMRLDVIDTVINVINELDGELEADISRIEKNLNIKADIRYASDTKLKAMDCDMDDLIIGFIVAHEIKLANFKDRLTNILNVIERARML